MRLWDLAERRHICSYRGHVGWVFAVAISPDSDIIASAGEDGVIRLWQTLTGEPLGALIGHTQFAADGQLAVLGRGNGVIECGDAMPAEPRRRLHAEAGRVWSLAAN